MALLDCNGRTLLSGRCGRGDGSEVVGGVVGGVRIYRAAASGVVCRPIPARPGPARPRREAVLLFGAIFTRNRLICLRPLPSITAASLGEKGGKRQTLAFCLKRNQ